MIEAKEEADTSQVDIMNTTVLKIYELLDDVVNGKNSLSVRVAGYGLTKAGGALSGTSLTGGTLSSLSYSDDAAQIVAGVNSAHTNSTVDLGGWVTTI